MITFPALSIEKTLARAARFNKLVGFGLTPEDFEQLKNMAPEWPSQPGHIRTLRLRKTKGHIIRENVPPEELMRWQGKEYKHLGAHQFARLKGAAYEDGVLTQYHIPPDSGGDGKGLFSQHVRMLHDTFPGFSVTRHLQDSDVHYAPCDGYRICRPDEVSWIVVNLFAYKKNVDDENLPVSQDWIGSQHRACADELLAALWIYPEAFTLAIKTLGVDTAWQATGYETSQSVPYGPLWSGLSVHFDHQTERFFLSDAMRSGFVPEIVTS